METEVKTEKSDNSDDETLPIQFTSNITGDEDGDEIDGTAGDDILSDEGDDNVISEYDDSDDDCQHEAVKAMKYRLLNADLLTSLMQDQSFVCALTRKFEEKLRWKMFQLMALLKCVVYNIRTHGAITRWDWAYALKEVTKIHNRKYNEIDISNKTLDLLDWLSLHHKDFVLKWKKTGVSNPVHQPEIELDDADSDVAMETEEGGGDADEEEFVVVKAEQDEQLNSSGNVGLENIEDEAPISLDSIKTEEEEVDSTEDHNGYDQCRSAAEVKTEENYDRREGKLSVRMAMIPVDESSIEAIKTEVDDDTEAGERFFHNGEELDLDDVLEDNQKDSDEEEKMKTESESEAEVPPEEQVDDEDEEEEKDGEEEYIPDETDEEDSEGEMEENTKKEDDQDEEEDDDEGEEEEEEENLAGNMSTSLTMLKQALMRKRGQSMANLTSSKGSNLTNQYKLPQAITVNMKPSDPNIGGTTHNFNDLSDLERTVLETAVQARMYLFKSTTCTVEEREKKMNVWKEITERVNNVVGGKHWTPEELVTIWSKKLFVEHVASKKSLVVNKVADQLEDGPSDKTAFKSLISKAKSDVTDTVQFSLQPGHNFGASTLQSQSASVKPLLGLVKKGELTPEESKVLEEQIDMYKEMLRSKKEDIRVKIWREIAKRVNAVDTRTFRTVDELKRKWTKDLLQTKLNLTTLANNRATGRPNKDFIIEKAKTISEVSATVSAPETDLPIKIELDNAESEQTQILSVVSPTAKTSTSGRSLLTQPIKLSQQSTSAKGPVKSSTSAQSLLYGRTPPLTEKPLSSKTKPQLIGQPELSQMKRGRPQQMTTTCTELVLYQLTDKTTMYGSSVTVPRACVRLQLVDKGLSGSVEVKEEPADDTIFSPDQYKVLTRLIQQKIDVIKLTGPSIVSLVLNTTDWEKLVRLVNKADASRVHSVPNVKSKVRTIISSLDNLLSMKNKKSSENTSEQSHKHSITADPEVPMKKIKVEPHDSLAKPRWAKGDMVKAQNEDGWVEGTIIDIDEDEYRAKIHFHGLSRQQNRWLPMTKDFITESMRCIVKLPKVPNRR